MIQYHPNLRHQREAIDWARYVLAHPRKYVILDTETTGLGPSDEIVQIAVIDLHGNALLSQNIRPTRKRRIASEASRVHGLTMKVLQDCPQFHELHRPLKKAIGRRRIITYNAEFDMRLYRQTYQLAGGFLPRGDWVCAMREYAKYVGEWNQYYRDYKWQRLESADHTALGDCRATLEVIRLMAAATKLKRWYEFWIGR